MPEDDPRLDYTREDWEPATDSLDLAAMIGSRICHDLNNPLGAIGNGLELMALNGHAAGQEMALISQSVESAKARVQFLRVAFGTATPSQRMGGPEIAGIVAAHARTARVRIDWQAMGEADRGAVRLAFLLLMCLEAALPFGGEVAVARSGPRWRLTGTAERMRDLSDLWAGVAGRAPMPEVSAPLVQFALAPQAARAVGRRVDVAVAEGGAVLEF